MLFLQQLSVLCFCVSVLPDIHIWVKILFPFLQRSQAMIDAMVAYSCNPIQVAELARDVAARAVLLTHIVPPNGNFQTRMFFIQYVFVKKSSHEKGVSCTCQ